MKKILWSYEDDKRKFGAKVANINQAIIKLVANLEKYKYYPRIRLYK